MKFGSHNKMKTTWMLDWMRTWLILVVLALESGIGSAPAARADIAAIRKDVEVIANARNQAVSRLAADYKKWEEREPGRVLTLVLSGGMLRGDLEVELKRWGGQWLTGAAVTPIYNRSRNPVDASRLMLSGDSLKGMMTVTLVSDGFVPAPGTTIDLVFDVEARWRDGKWSGTYRAHANAQCKGSAPSNRMQYDATINRPSTGPKDNPKALAALMARAPIEQTEHWGELTGKMESFAFRVSTDEPVDLSTAQDIVGLERLADTAYQQLRATMLARKLWVSYDEALALSPLCVPKREGAMDVSVVAERVKRMSELIEVVAGWDLMKAPCPMEKIQTEDPWFAGYVESGALASEPGQINLVPRVDAAGRQSWRHVQGWQVLGPWNDRRDLDTLLPMPQMVSDGGEAIIVEDGGRRVTLSWRTIAEHPGAFADVGATLGGGGHQACYMVTELNSAVAQEVWLAVLPDDYCRVWINDRLVWANWDPQKDRSVFQVPLKAGKNRLLVRCANETHQWGISLQVCVSGRPHTAAEQATVIPATPLKTIGWFGPGHRGVYPEADPVMAWDVKQGINVIWRLPFTNQLRHLNKSISTPLVVGDKVFTQCEPHTLICVDKMTGRILWERDSNVLEFLENAEERAQALADYQEEKSGEVIVQGKAELEKLEQELAEVSVKLEADQNNEELRARGTALAAKIKAMQRSHGKTDRWSAKLKTGGVSLLGNGGWFGDYVGYTASTPVTDGTHLYVKYGTGVAACYDLDGNRLWMVPTHFHDQTVTSMPSPMLAGDKLIIVGGARHWRGRSDRPPLPEKAESHKAEGWMVALDTKTGKRVWDAGPIRHAAYGICATPLPMRLSNGQETMWVIVTNRGQLLRAEDGRLLRNDFGVSAGFYASPIAVGNTVYFTRSGHMDAVELRMMDRDSVAVRPLWTSPKGGNAGIVVRDGLIYGTPEASHRGSSDALGYVVKDQATGTEIGALSTVLPGGQGFAYTPIVTAGNYVFASSEYGMAVVQRGANPRPLFRAENKERMIARPTFDGNRMYLRTYQSLMCIGLKGEEGAAFQRQAELNALSELIPGQLTRPVVVPLRTRYDGTIPDALPVWKILTGATPTPWLLAGPFPIQEKAEAVVTLAGAEGDWPRAGTKARLGNSEGVFVTAPLAKTGQSGIEVSAENDPPGGTDRLYYTVFDNRDGGRFFRVELNGADHAIMAGEMVRNGETVRIDGCGLVPVFVRVRFGPDTPPFLRRIVLQVRLLEVEDPMVAYHAAIVRLRVNADALERIKQLAPNSSAAMRAEEALAVLKLESTR